MSPRNVVGAMPLRLTSEARLSQEGTSNAHLQGGLNFITFRIAPLNINFPYFRTFCAPGFQDKQTSGSRRRYTRIRKANHVQSCLLKSTFRLQQGASMTIVWQWHVHHDERVSFRENKVLQRARFLLGSCQVSSRAHGKLLGLSLAQKLSL